MEDPASPEPARTINMRTIALPITGFLCLVLTHSGHAQARPILGAPATPSSLLEQGFDPALLDEAFTAWSAYKLDPRAVRAAVAQRAGETSITLALGNAHIWRLDLWRNGLIAPDYVSLAATDGGIIERPRIEPFTYSGRLSDVSGSWARFSIREDELLGSVSYGDLEYMIEPLRHFDPAAPMDLFVVYRVEDMIAGSGVECGNSGIAELVDGYDLGAPKDITACQTARIALAADYSFVSWRGGVAAAETRMIDLLNIVDGRFMDPRIEISHLLVATFLSTSTANDRWDPTTDASTLLDSFRWWGNNGGFGGGAQFSVASLWTRRNISSGGSTGVIGMAYVGGACGSDRFNINQHSTTSTGLPSVCQTHEIGHNWNAQHATGCNSTCIMAASISANNTQWDNTTISSINGHKSRVSCLINNCGVGIHEPGWKMDLAVYPNPSDGRFLVEWAVDRGGRPVRMELLNATGQRVRDEGITGRDRLVLDFDGGPGMYLLRMLDRNDNVIGTHRLVRY